MSEQKIRELLEAGGHKEHIDAVVALIQPAVRIIPELLAPRPLGWRRPGEDFAAVESANADAIAAMDAALDALPVGASRFGGVPDLPADQPWPERDGVPMEFIAQLRLADVAPHDSENRLPAAGSLLVFYNSQWGHDDMEPDAATCAVVFHDGPDDALVRAAPPRVEWTSEFSDVSQIAPMVHGLASLTFAPIVTVPGGVSPFIGPELEFWQDFQADNHVEITGDGEQHQVLGYVDEQDYVDAHVNGTDDQLLLQVDSSSITGTQFGDWNKLFFLMTRAELAARDFSNVRVYSMLG